MTALAFEWPWQQSADTGKTHFGQALGGVGRGLSWLGPGAGIHTIGYVAHHNVGGKIAHGVDLQHKAMNKVDETRQFVADQLGAVQHDFANAANQYQLGLTNFQRQESAALADVFSNVGRGLGLGAGYAVGGTLEGSLSGLGSGLGGVASGIGGGAATVGTGIGEGAKALALPILLGIGLLFLYKKVK